MSGRRVTALAGAGGWDVSAGPLGLMRGAAVLDAAPSTAWIGPGSVGRSLAAAGRDLAERWQADLDLPAAVWEVSGDAGPITLAWAMSGAEGLALSEDSTRLRARSTSGPVADLVVSGGRLSIERGSGSPRVVCRGAGQLRVLVAGGSDEADHARTLQRLARGPARMADAWRQHDRSATRLETPDPTVDRAFLWAWRRTGALARPADSSSSADPPARPEEGLPGAAVRFLADPAALDAGPAEAVLRAALVGLWGVTPETSSDAVTLHPLLPAEWPMMALHRLRVGRTLLDVELRRRRGDLVARLRRRFGPRVVITLAPRGAWFESVVVDDVELPGGRVRFEAADRHVIVFRGALA